MGLFVDQNCIIAAVQMGFAETGKYMVAMYSYYKSSEYPCKILLERLLSSMTADERREFKTKHASEYQRECKLMGYKIRWIDVDTRAERAIVTRSYLIDIKGFHASDLKTDKDWTPLATLERDPFSRPTATAIRRTTDLVEKELAYFNYRYR